MSRSSTKSRLRITKAVHPGDSLTLSKSRSFSSREEFPASCGEFREGGEGAPEQLRTIEPLDTGGGEHSHLEPPPSGEPGGGHQEVADHGERHGGQGEHQAKVCVTGIQATSILGTNIRRRCIPYSGQGKYENTGYKHTQEMHPMCGGKHSNLELVGGTKKELDTEGDTGSTSGGRQRYAVQGYRIQTYAGDASHTQDKVSITE